MKNYFDVAGKYAVVTGASSGLGRQFALCLAEQGCNVAIAARRVERLEEVKKEVEAYGVKCLVLPCDVTDTEQIRNSVDKVVKEFGRIDILINNAAASFATPVVETTDEQWYNVDQCRRRFLLCKRSRKGYDRPELRKDHQHRFLPLPGNHEWCSAFRLFHCQGRSFNDVQGTGCRVGKE